MMVCAEECDQVHGLHGAEAFDAERDAVIGLAHLGRCIIASCEGDVHSVGGTFHIVAVAGASALHHPIQLQVSVEHGELACAIPGSICPQMTEDRWSKWIRLPVVNSGSNPASSKFRRVNSGVHVEIARQQVVSDMVNALG